MCGIVGYVGHREAEPILVEGLRRLEYRGYDSSGLATVTGSQLHLRKRAGRIADLVQYLSTRPVPGCHGISHTRWATHGPATDGNAHPHIGGDDTVAVVHNGIIENYAQLRQQLIDEGHTFRSETDTEVLSHLIEHAYFGVAQHNLEAAVRLALQQVRGSYAIAVVSQEHPDMLAYTGMWPGRRVATRRHRRRILARCAQRCRVASRHDAARSCTLGRRSAPPARCAPPL